MAQVFNSIHVGPFGPALMGPEHDLERASFVGGVGAQGREFQMPGVSATTDTQLPKGNGESSIEERQALIRSGILENEELPRAAQFEFVPQLPQVNVGTTFSNETRIYNAAGTNQTLFCDTEHLRRTVPPMVDALDRIIPLNSVFSESQSASSPGSEPQGNHESEDGTCLPASMATLDSTILKCEPFPDWSEWAKSLRPIYNDTNSGVDGVMISFDFFQSQCQIGPVILNALRNARGQDSIDRYALTVTNRLPAGYQDTPSQTGEFAIVRFSDTSGAVWEVVQDMKKSSPTMMCLVAPKGCVSSLQPEKLEDADTSRGIIGLAATELREMVEAFAAHR